MWFWFHSGWLFLVVPLAMIFACVLMCIVMCRPSKGGCMRCCDHTHSNERHS